MKKLLLFLILIYGLTFAQLTVPNDGAGDPRHLKKGFMDGNRVYVQFKNTTELGDCCNKGYPVAIWPNNYNATKSHDGIWFQIGAEVFIDTSTGEVVDDLETAKTSDKVVSLKFVQTNTREALDEPPEGGFKYGLYPTGGYQSLTTETPAMSDKPDSWPENGWPAVGKFGNDTLIFKDSWNGRFGQDVFKADLSCYFVANDAQDLEKIREDRFEGMRYYPRGENFKIGDIDPFVTVQNGSPWGGIGVRTAVRGYQWSNPQAQDVIFWEYNVTNISDYTLPNMYFAYEADNAVGGEEYIGADDNAYYKIVEEVNMCFVWDQDFVSVGGGKEPGVIGFAFLESPGINNDGVDNDNDGIIDEKRENLVVNGESTVGAYDGIYDLEKFVNYFDYEDLTEEELYKKLDGHYAADEDKDWEPWVDLNGNGTFDIDYQEPIGDDVGTDGIGPYDVLYTGPDANGTEANGKPDCILGLGSEPNFGTTDVNETDQLGLQNFNYIGEDFKYNGWGAGTFGAIEDEKNFGMHYERITAIEPSEKYDDSQPRGMNFHHAFSSGMFKMDPGTTERMSLAELHSYDPLAGLELADPQAPALTRLAEVTNKIYEADYRFAQPPVMPALTAVAGDGKVYLSWDAQSEELTREVMLGNINDFEGYKLYRASDKQMSDPMVITDLNGGTVFRKPIFQCDIVNDKYGPSNYGLVNGTGYDLGSNSGIVHSFIDSTVQNGIKYYYALVAYDYGLPKVGDGISPSENKIIIRKNESEEVIEISKNVAIVTPHQKAAGYVPAGIASIEDNSFGNGYVLPEIMVEKKVIGDKEYKVSFPTVSVDVPNVKNGIVYWNTGIKIHSGDNLVYEENYLNYPGRNIMPFRSEYSNGQSYRLFTGSEIQTDIFDGLRLSYCVPSFNYTVDTLESTWRTGEGRINLYIAPAKARFLPYDCEIIFSSNDNTPIINHGEVIGLDGNALNSGELIFNASLNLHVKDMDNSEILPVIVHDLNGNGSVDLDSDRFLVGATSDDGQGWAAMAFAFDFIGTSTASETDDSYFVTFNRGFKAEDEIVFTTNASEDVNKKQLDKEMAKIKVVPNPYVITNNMEPNVMNEGFNQRRRILFTNIPAQCDIKIYTISGLLVDEIDVDNSEETSTDLESNSAANGTIKWDVLTKEGLDVAAGYYIYHVKSKVTGKEKVGKFAIIK